MKITRAEYSGGSVTMYNDAGFGDIKQLHDINKTLIFTDELIFSLHEKKFSGYTVIKTAGGEPNKTQAEVDRIILQMLELNIDKSWLLVGAGGGVVTDIAGYVASIYKRGIKLGLAPTTILGMTDAAIGGKNGVNVGMYKNMVGTTYRPQFILYDQSFLDTLPREEFINGFAEIIKHACIKDAAMFEELQNHDINYYIENKDAAAALVERNIAVKTGIVISDEYETGERFLLNFGHTFGHAIENLYSLPHGRAVSIGMVIAAKISESLAGFNPASTKKLAQLLQQYGLPVSYPFDIDKVTGLLTRDKKRQGDLINFVLLRDIGDAMVQQLSFEKLRSISEKIIQ